MKTASATAAGAGRMQKHPWAAQRVGGRHPGEPSGMTAFPGTCSQIWGDNSPRAAVTNWDLRHRSLSRDEQGHGQKGRHFKC